MGSLSPSDKWLTTLDDYNARLADRLNFLGLRTQLLGTTVPSAMALAVEELATAAEELRVTHEELRAQTLELADSQGQMEAARRHYQELFDLCPDAYLVTDAAGLIQEANQATSALVGYARTYVLGKPLAALLDPSAVDAFTTKLAALRQAADDRPQTWELAVRPRRSGAPLQASIRVAPIRDAAGALTGFRWLVHDLSAQRAMAAALAQLQTTQAQTLRTRTMELEAVLRMKDQMRALDQSVLQRLVHDAVQSLQHGAEAGSLLAHVLTNLQDHLNRHGQSGQTHPAMH